MTIDKWIFLLGRIFLGLFFLINAANHFNKTDYMTQYAASKGVPSSRLMVQFTGLLLAIAGFSFLLGIYPILGIVAATIFFVGVTPVMHNFWSVEDPQEAQNQMIQFMKNVAILGAVLMFSVFTSSQWNMLGFGLTI